MMMNEKNINITGRLKYVLLILLAVTLFGGNSILMAASISEKENIAQQEEVYQKCDQWPEFKGGVKAWTNFLKDNLKYPSISQENGVQGRVIVEFIVETNGKITNAKVIKKVDPHLDKEALRLINLMPKWKPGKHKGKKVRVKYTQPIIFRLK